MGQSFDPVSNELSGDPVTIDTLTVPTAVAGLFSVSHAGNLAYSRTVLASFQDAHFIWLSKGGKEAGTLGLKGAFVGPAISPDGRYLTVGKLDNLGLWVFDIGTRILTSVRSSPVNSPPRWSADGRIAFSAVPEGKAGLYERRFGVVGSDQLIFGGIAPMLSDWSSDGRYLAYHSGGDVWALPLFGERKPVQITQTSAAETFPRISPNGEWIAYESNEPGTPEVYVRSFPDSRFVRQVSISGGYVPRWSRDGRELFYVAPDKTLMSVSVISSQAEPEFGSPVKLFSLPIALPFLQEYDVAPDGRFLVNAPAANAVNAPITVIVNWPETLK